MTEWKGEIDNSTIIVGEFNNSISIIYNTTGQRKCKDIEYLNNTIINHLVLTNIYVNSRLYVRPQKKSQGTSLAIQWLRLCVPLQGVWVWSVVMKLLSSHVVWQKKFQNIKLNIQKTEIMASGPITSWQIDGKQWNQWQTSFSWAQSVDGDCSHEIKRLLLFGRKAMTHLDSILKSKDITLPTKVHIVKAMVFQ